MIARRHVFHIGGYDPISPEQQVNRLERSLSVFQRTWGVRAGIVSAIEATPVSAFWVVEASGPNWSTRTSCGRATQSNTTTSTRAR